MIVEEGAYLYTDSMYSRIHQHWSIPAVFFVRLYVGLNGVIASVPTLVNLLRMVYYLYSYAGPWLCLETA